MKTIKFTTKHLVCYYNFDDDNYQIFELGKEYKPVCIYVDLDHIFLANEIPHANDYEFIAEIREIIKFLNN